MILKMRRKTYLLNFISLIIIILINCSLFFPVNADESMEEIKAKCRSAAGSKNCGECIKQDPECAWCSDLRSNITARCDLKSALSTCAKQHIYSPTTELKVAPQHNLPLGGRRPDSATPIQLEPQQIEIKMKPEDVVEVPFHYLHKPPASGYEVKDFTIQTSEFQSLGLQIDFSIECNGERKNGRVCPGLVLEQKVSFYAKISLKDCSNKNLIAVSVGIYGYNTVSAIFVTPLCGCDCENPRYQEKRSPRCNYQGNLVCGVCVCDQGKGGERCECDLNHYGVSHADDLINQCRENKDANVCSGKGKCSCGRCTCEADYIRGRYCECNNGNCPLSVDGRMCSGKGECRCGKCVCEPGFNAEDCSCTENNAPCIENNVICSGKGFCECGKCSCNNGWTGATCSIQKSGDTSESSSNENEVESVEKNESDLLQAEEEIKSVEEKDEDDVPDSAFSQFHNKYQIALLSLLNSIALAFCLKLLV